MSEEQQLEAAIKASLRESVHKSSRKHRITDSDDFVSLSSEEEEEESLSMSVMEHDGGSDRDTTDGLTKLEHSSHYSEADLRSRSTTTNTYSTVSVGNSASSSTVSENNCKHLQSRKRKSAGRDTDEFISPVRKMPRSNTSSSCEDTRIQTTGSESSASEGVSLSQHQLRPGKGASNSRRKGKQKAPSSVTVEDKLQSGQLQKVDVTQVVIRLPDGVRIQKAFLCNKPIMVSD